MNVFPHLDCKSKSLKNETPNPTILTLISTRSHHFIITKLIFRNCICQNSRQPHLTLNTQLIFHVFVLVYFLLQLQMTMKEMWTTLNVYFLRG